MDKFLGIFKMAVSAMLDYKLLNNFVIYAPILMKLGEIVHLTLMNRPILLQFMNFLKTQDGGFRHVGFTSCVITLLFVD